MQATENQNEWINWIEESISEKRIKHYEYKHFNNIKEIDSEGYRKVFRVNWKKSEQYLSLKSFKKFDNPTVKELVNELKLRRDIEFHNNIVRFYGITTISDQENEKKEYLLVTEYADSGSLQNYLKKNFNRLTWNDKYKLAYQLVCAVSCLHDEGIVHLDLHSKSILIHQNIVKLADFGLIGRIENASKNRSKLFGNIPYIDPKRLIKQTYKLDEKSDVYSVGVLLWEISSGRPPFHTEGKAYDIGLIYEISQGNREKPIPDTPDAYVKIYTECWNHEPDDRPTMGEVVDQLISAKNNHTHELERETQRFNAGKTSNCSSDGIKRINDDIVKPISTIFNEIFNGIAKKHEEREPKGAFDKKNPDENNPDENNPGKNNPGKNNPGKINPGKINPGKINPDENNPGKINPDENNPGKNNPDENNPGKINPGENNPGKNDPDENNPGKKHELKDWLSDNREDLDNLGIGTSADRQNVADLFFEFGNAWEKKDRNKFIGLLGKTGGAMMASMLQDNRYRNDEEFLEMVESTKEDAQRTMQDPCNIN